MSDYVFRLVILIRVKIVMIGVIVKDCVIVSLKSESWLFIVFFGVKLICFDY